MRPILRALGALILGCVVLAVTAGPGSAHSELIDSTPRAGLTADDAVSSVVLTFESEVKAELADVVVTRDGTEQVTGEPSVQGSVVTVPVEPLDVAGTYQVAYRVVAADGHPVAGSYGFRVSAASAAQARALDTVQTVATPGGVPAPPAPAQIGRGVVDLKDLAPELGLGALAALIVAASLVRRSRLRHQEGIDG